MLASLCIARELGWFDFSWYRSNVVTTAGPFPRKLLGDRVGPIQSAEITVGDGDATPQTVWQQQFAGTGGKLTVRIRDYYYASGPTLWLPLYKFGRIVLTSRGEVP